MGELKLRVLGRAAEGYGGGSGRGGDRSGSGDTQVGGAAAAATTRGAGGISESKNTAVFLLLKCKLHYCKLHFFSHLKKVGDVD